jgi:hypothetical protein
MTIDEIVIPLWCSRIENGFHTWGVERDELAGTVKRFLASD